MKRIVAGGSSIVVLVAVLGIGRTAVAFIVDYDPPQEYVRRADVVALVTIQNRQDLECKVDNVVRPCGAVYTAKVVDVVKGTASSLEFFSNLPPKSFDSSKVVVLLTSSPEMSCETIEDGREKDCKKVAGHGLHFYYGAMSQTVETDANGEKSLLVTFGDPYPWFQTDNLREVVTDSEGRRLVPWPLMRSSIVHWMKLP